MGYSILSDIVGVVDREDLLEAVDPEDGMISDADPSMSLLVAGTSGTSIWLLICSSLRMSDTGLRGTSSSVHPVVFSK